MVKGDLVGIRLERLHTAALLWLFHDAQDFVFGDHQVFITGEVHKDGVGQFRAEQGQHADQQIGHGIQRPRRPGRVRCPDDQRTGQPDQDAQPRAHREHLGLIHITDAAEFPHGVNDGFVLQAAHAVGPEGLDAGYILHDAADVLRADVVLLPAVFPHHAEGKPQPGDQQQIRRQQDQPGGDVDSHDKHDQHEGQGETLCQVPDLVGQDLFIVVDVAGDGVDVVAGLPLGKSGQRDTLEVVTHEEADVFADLRAADLGLRVAITVNQDTEL